MYYEDEGRSYDYVVRRDLTVTDEEIQSLCQQMKKVAVRNARLEGQKTSVKDVTKSQLLSWGLLKEGEDWEDSSNQWIYFPARKKCFSFGNPVRCIQK